MQLPAKVIAVREIAKQTNTAQNEVKPNADAGQSYFDVSNGKWVRIKPAVIFDFPDVKNCEFRSQSRSGNDLTGARL